MKKFEILKNVLEKRFNNLEHINAIYAYGSAAIQQIGNISENNMIDLFFIVDDIEKFHKQNLVRNKNDYSFVGRNLPLKWLLRVNRFGTGVYYNPSIEIQDESSQRKFRIKYGVIEEMQFKRFLSKWENLFIPGRFHKPVLSIKESNELQQTIQKNREMAVSLISLCSPEAVEIQKFLQDIIEISFKGDFRTYFKAEKPEKTKNLLLGAYPQYLEIYQPILKKIEILSIFNAPTFDEKLKIKQTKNSLNSHFQNLPQNIKEKILRSNKDNLEFLNNFLDTFSYNERKILIEKILKDLNFKYSFYGILTGLYSTNLDKNVS
jgi:translocator assembly and maintenance protein 41